VQVYRTVVRVITSDQDARFVAYLLLVPHFIDDKGLKSRCTNVQQFIALAPVCKSHGGKSGFRDLVGTEHDLP
jgi:hypothetical protein